MSNLNLKLRNRHLSSDKPVVMGILNVTPDSFSDGGKYNSVDLAFQQIDKMINGGATIIDIGGESTRPGADPVSTDLELKRVLPVIQKAVQIFPETYFSIDTTKYRVAKEALEHGVHIVNDISGLRSEPRLASLCAEFKAGYVLMHSKGDPKTMQENPVYSELMPEIELFFQKGLKQLEKEGVESVMIDPGIGFGKTLDHNVEIIRNLKRFKKFDLPILMGVSRKSMIGQILNNRPADGRLAGTIAVHYQCLINGALILRVHDVLEAMDSIKIYCELKGNGG